MAMAIFHTSLPGFGSVNLKKKEEFSDEKYSALPCPVAFIINFRRMWWWR
jgi:hypothetical protein